MVSSVLISDAVENLTEGLSSADGKQVMDAYAFAREAYADHSMRSGQPAIEFSKSIGLILAELNSDAQTRIAGLLAVLPEHNPEAGAQLEARFGVEVDNLVDSARKLFRLRDLTGSLDEIGHGKNAAQIRKAQAETLRKMLLAMAADMRVVMIRLAARMAALRYLASGSWRICRSGSLTRKPIAVSRKVWKKSVPSVKNSSGKSWHGCVRNWMLPVSRPM